MTEEFEMIPCPKCGRPFPKRRKELGYNYCCECSTEKSKTYRIENQGEGEDVCAVLTILTQEEALAIDRAEKRARADQMLDQEPAPDYSTFEEQDEQQSEENSRVLRDETQLTQADKEFAGMSERSVEEMEKLAPLIDDDEEESEDSLEE